jgi:hypothetical protein
LLLLGNIINLILFFFLLQRENQLRQHNFIPLTYNILRLLAERKKLQPLAEEAKKKKQRPGQPKQ